MSISQGFQATVNKVYVYQENDNVSAPSINVSAAFGLVPAVQGAWCLTVSSEPGAVPNSGAPESTDIILVDFSSGNVTISPIGMGSVIIEGLYVANIIIDVPHDNIFIGHGVGNGQDITAYNTITGANAAQHLTTGTSNCIYGYNAGNLLTTGSYNSLLSVGTGSLMTSATNNVAIGPDALSFLTTGNGNVVISGNRTNSGGQNYTSSEANNILLGAQGVALEESVFRVGDAFGFGPGLISAVYLQGIQGVTNGGTLPGPGAVNIDENGQLGQQLFTSLDSSVTLTQTDNGHLDFSVSSSGVTGTPNEIDVTAGVVSLDADIIFPGTGTFPLGQSLSFGTDYVMQSIGDPTNFFINSGSFSGTPGSNDQRNIGIGYLSVNNLQNGGATDNIGIGYEATSGPYNSIGNVGVGSGTLTACSGYYNVAVGFKAFHSLEGGSVTGYNIGIGYQAGVNNTGNTSDSSNIYLNNPGVSTESNRMRLGAGTGTGTQQITQSFISGIQTATVAGTLAAATFVVVDGSDQVGQCQFTSLDGSIVFTQTDNGHLDLAASTTASDTYAYTPIDTASSPYTVLSTDYYIGVTLAAAPITVKLPNAPATGRVFIVKDSAGLAATHNITVTTVGGAVNIDGNATFVMNADYQAASFIFNGTTYEVF
jgi:hypothetical protein